MPAASVTAVVVAYDSAHALPDCLGALAREGVPAIVIDNASTDGSAEVAARLCAEVIRNPVNEGYGRANNRGVAAAKMPFVLIINPDVILDEGAVAALLDAAERYPDAGLLAPVLVEPDGRHFFQPRSLLAPYLHNPAGTERLPEGDCCAPFLSGAIFLMRRDLFLGLGGFDPRIFLFYEDDDLCRRVADAGHSLIHVAGATARHGRGRSSAPAPGRIFRGRWHQAWSRAYVSRKYGLPNPAPAMAFRNALKWLGAALIFNRGRMARYGGSAAGAIAALRGMDALAYQGIPSKEE
ncbi:MULTISPECIES: glycosyltransferase family 2 protein [unclassified Chelatococcus]|uniref:glycosyltransferase family 2 protein n=1 Tax=unclassified Chelatococcus TaxID=2638111 RepID=UPI001BCCC30B|nr:MULTISPECIES: glycosyltransferase family 2 protein [unclassified Chelatococcus]CAH1669891.1 GT2 family glycosyltransferase [Hyphomicrobiales bacterium]MBS7738266.1 glycosyltransferase family 2 protein [Chelatococcus sp. HY11]MBX3545794.1 glycosyltransferase family 2 protein [Chelatococcus sp.]MCO5077388.1 glycosyltransferase family 2 protein [Chelatococcus sp.]CAH1677872.1 GT2 family glycosyltransferase [Hyphomicrobiales bacterium]